MSKSSSNILFVLILLIVDGVAANSISHGTMLVMNGLPVSTISILKQVCPHSSNLVSMSLTDIPNMERDKQAYRQRLPCFLLLVAVMTQMPCVGTYQIDFAAKIGIGTGDLLDW